MGALRRMLVALRWLAVLAPGYIHPDEFFQGPEPMSRDILQLQATIPWEFAETPPCRSVISAILTSGIPLLIVRLMRPCLGSHWIGVAVLLAPRIWMVALSFTLDNAIVRLCEVYHLRSHMESMLLVFGSAWPGLLMLSRPFSNSLEAVLLGAALIVAAGSPDRADAARRWRWFGIISALGVFTRFTFVVFGAVLSVWMAVNTLGTSVLQRSFRRDTRARDRQMWCMLLSDVCGGAAAFLAASAAIILADSLYFRTLSLTYNLPHHGTASVISPDALLRRVVLGGADMDADVVDGDAGALLTGLGSRVAQVGYTGHLTLTPLNSYRYNADPENLAKHGLHPRWTHALVNMPMMFGPLAVLGLLDLLNWLVYVARSKNVEKLLEMAGAASDTTGSPGTKRSRSPTSGRDLRILSVSIVILYLGGLSTAPHQEARFLLPLLLPMSILYGAHFSHSKSTCSPSDAGTNSNANFWSSQSSTRMGQQPLLSFQRLVVIWIAFNVVVSLFFGGLHQAGVSRALVDLGAGTSLDAHDDTGHDTTESADLLLPDATLASVGSGSASIPITVVFFHTYMPPVSLAAQCITELTPPPEVLAQRGEDYSPSICPGSTNVKILDLTSNSSIAALDTTISNLLMRDTTRDDEHDIPVEAPSRHVYVVSPGSMDLGAMFNDLYGGDSGDGRAKITGAPIQLVLEPKMQWWPHLSMEDPPWEATAWGNRRFIDHVLKWTRREGDSGDGLLTLVLWRVRVVL